MWITQVTLSVIMRKEVHKEAAAISCIFEVLQLTYEIFY